MARGTVVTDQSDFDQLLAWLDEDRELAARKYEAIRLRLTKIFSARGCTVAEELADDTIDRVTKKVSAIADGYEGDPAIYFYGVARIVFLEFTRKPVTNELPLHLADHNKTENDELERQDECLEKCLKKLPAGQKSFIIKYYKRTKTEKIKNRLRMMEEFEITAETLRVRAFRIRDKLQKCVFTCLE